MNLIEPLDHFCAKCGVRVVDTSSGTYKKCPMGCDEPEDAA